MKKSQFAKLVAECVGTFFLVLTIGCNVHNGSLGAALSIGSMLMVMIYALGSVSGGHFNPAVTLAIAMSGRDKICPYEAVLYVLSQLVGGIAASMLYWSVVGDAFVLSPVGSYTLRNAAAVEILYTAALCYVVLNVATTTTKEQGNGDNGYFALAIGFTVVAAAIAIGPISGCSLNPAVSAGSLCAAYLHHGGSAMHHWALYIFAPFAGAALASLAFFLVQGGTTDSFEYFEVAAENDVTPTASTKGESSWDAVTRHSTRGSPAELLDNPLYRKQKDDNKSSSKNLAG